MARLTISVSDRDHYALRLLSIRDRKRLTAIVDEAIKLYLASCRAYKLTIANSDTGQSDFTEINE